MLNRKIDIKYIQSDLIKVYDKNAKKHPKEQIQGIQESIKRFGFKQPILIDKNNVIIAGHGRYEAAKKLKLTDIPCVVDDNLTDEEIAAYRIIDNKLAETGYDLDLLIGEITALPDFDFNPFNIDLPTIEIVNEGLCDPDDVPEIKDEPVTKVGDVWILDDHLLMCGDSTMIDQVEKLMNGEKADIGFTSPPYNANKNAGGLIDKKYQNDEDAKDDDEYLQFLIDATNNSMINCDYSFINIQMLSHNKQPLFDWQNHFKTKIKDIFIWVKNIAPPQINKGTFNSKWEYVFCFSDQSKSRAFPCKWQGQYPNVIDSRNNSQNEYADIHKATFPVEFPVWVIEKLDFCKSVLDLFGGSGSTLIACEKTNRKCYMMELSPQYCDVIIKRWQKFTGKNAIHESTQKKFSEMNDAEK